MSGGQEFERLQARIQDLWPDDGVRKITQVLGAEVERRQSGLYEIARVRAALKNQESTFRDGFFNMQAELYRLQREISLREAAYPRIVKLVNTDLPLLKESTDPLVRGVERWLYTLLVHQGSKQPLRPPDILLINVGNAFMPNLDAFVQDPKAAEKILVVENPKASLRLTPMDDSTYLLSFELNNIWDNDALRDQILKPSFNPDGTRKVCTPHQTGIIHFLIDPRDTAAPVKCLIITESSNNKRGYVRKTEDLSMNLEPLEPVIAEIRAMLTPTGGADHRPIGGELIIESDTTYLNLE